MSAPAITMDVRRVGEKTAVVDIKGEVTAACEPVLMSAYEAAGGSATSRLSGKTASACSAGSGKRRSGDTPERASSP